MKKLVIVALLSSAVTYYVSITPAPIVNEVTYVTINRTMSAEQIMDAMNEREFQRKLATGWTPRPAYSLQPIVEDINDLI